jgi:hypothetical protein
MRDGHDFCMRREFVLGRACHQLSGELPRHSIAADDGFTERLRYGKWVIVSGSLAGNVPFQFPVQLQPPAALSRIHRSDDKHPFKRKIAEGLWATRRARAIGISGPSQCKPRWH